MRDLLPLFNDNPFASSRISDRKLNRYSQAHLHRVAASEAFAEMASVTLKLHELYFGAISDEKIQLNIQTNLTNIMNHAFDEFRDLVSQNEGYFRFQWGKLSFDYHQLYPHGISEYRNSNLQTVEPLMLRYASVLEKHKTDLPTQLLDVFLAPTTETEIGGVIPRFQAARIAQQQAMGETLESQKERALNRESLEAQLWENVLTIAASVAKGTEAEKREAFRLIPQHMLRNAKRTKDDDSSNGGTEEFEVIGIPIETSEGDDDSLPRKDSDSDAPVEVEVQEVMTS